MDGSYDYMGMVTRVGAFRDAILHASGDLVPFYYEQDLNQIAYNIYCSCYYIISVCYLVFFG